MSDWIFLRRVLMVTGVVGFALMIWQAYQAFLLLFAAILIALLLGRATKFVERHTPLPRPFALLLVVLLIVGSIAGVIYQFGAQIAGQMNDLAQRLPGAVDNLEQRFDLGDVSGKLMEQARSNSGSILFQITTVASSVLNLVGNLIIVLVTAAFLAAQPDLYRRGVLRLFPAEHRDLAGQTIEDSGTALNQWLLGQLISMALVGMLTAFGLWMIGLPAPLALGLLAALTEFVPIVGPLIGAVPAVLLAFSVDWTMVAWTIGVFAVVQQLESNMITPLIQHRMVSLPPVVTMFAILAFGLLFGPLGLFLATPLAVLTYVLVARLYIRELLDEPTTIPGQEAAAEKVGD